MAAYLSRRVLLVVPTLLGIMVLNFVIVQFAPGGPIEQIAAEMMGATASTTDSISGGGDDGMVASSSDPAAAITSYRALNLCLPEYVGACAWCAD